MYLEFFKLLNNKPQNPLVIIAKKDKEKFIKYSEIDDYNNDGYDIYFQVNNGFPVNHFNACFVDMDAGKIDGKYLSLEQVRLAKIVMLEEIRRSLPPSYILETRNGYHCYWFINKTISDKVKWDTLQRKLCHSFTYGDPLILKDDQLMRVPGTIAYKNGKYEPYKTSQKIVSYFFNYSKDTLWNKLLKYTHTCKHIPKLNSWSSVNNKQKFLILRLMSNYFVL